ncbi:uncharacterized protein Pyn_38469 [Prunus yedoensis var. nudiflora]|uniref:Uncharacterized protein n=1 Tax=Prunus yedoensis var. nudiflora TaxID=2094558 RepID=A0A314YP83_PRUYE|nr:uncharacterized protein Pyn_38469 [Prunus yedoensis var. nudiflora]
MLPFAIEKDGLASLLEWELRNYSQSLIRIIGFQINSATEKHALSSNGVASYFNTGAESWAMIYKVRFIGILLSRSYTVIVEFMGCFDNAFCSSTEDLTMKARAIIV